MRIGRFARGRGPDFWGAIDRASGMVVALPGDLPTWAPRFVAQGHLDAGGARYDLGDLSIRAPLDPAGRVFGVGANYRSHVEGLGAELPDAPVAFVMPNAAVIGADTDIRNPDLTDELDFEVELVVVMAETPRPGRPMLEAVLGYTLGNDVSARDAASPYGGPDLYGMKALDAKTPVGPWITTRDELGGTEQPVTELRLRVNGELRQRARTDDMVFGVEAILAFLNERTRLRAGDLIFTGTTGGVGREDGRYLREGDRIEIDCPDIGTLRSTVGPRLAIRT